MPCPAVSFVIPVYNAAPYLRETLASVRWQTFEDWEAVCVDDGSTDASAAILADFAAADPRFRVLRQANSGITAALTRGDRAARSDLIARLDSDDVATPDRLERQLAYLRGHPECVGVGSQAMLIDRKGAPMGRQAYALDHEEIERRLLAGEGGTVAHPALTFRREAAERVGGHRAAYEWAHDADLLVRLTRVGRLANLPELLLLYRQHPRNTSRIRHAEIRTQMLGLLREAYAARGTQLPPSLADKLSKPSRQSSLIGKWARRAARNGYPATAWRLWREQLAQSPTAPETWRCGAEALLRAAVAVALGRRGEPIDLPDWRRFDCPTRAGARVA